MAEFWPADFWTTGFWPDGFWAEEVEVDVPANGAWYMRVVMPMLMEEEEVAGMELAPGPVLVCLKTTAAHTVALNTRSSNTVTLNTRIKQCES